jgi:hypothetical protein
MLAAILYDKMRVAARKHSDSEKTTSYLATGLVAAIAFMNGVIGVAIAGSWWRLVSSLSSVRSGAASVDTHVDFTHVDFNDTIAATASSSVKA